MFETYYGRNPNQTNSLPNLVVIKEKTKLPSRQLIYCKSWLNLKFEKNSIKDISLFDSKIHQKTLKIPYPEQEQKMTSKDVLNVVLSVLKPKRIFLTQP